MYSRAFWKDALERALSTAAQVAIGVLTAGAVTDLSANWQEGLTVVGVATAVSILKSIAAAARPDTISPASLVK